MGQISPSDNLFATAYIRGVEVFNFSGNGISDFCSLVEKLRDHAPLKAGMVTINVRNSSRGWCHSRSIYLS